MKRSCPGSDRVKLVSPGFGVVLGGSNCIQQAQQMATPLPCSTEVRNGQFSSGGGILSPLQWYQSDIQKFGFPKYEIKDN